MYLSIWGTLLLFWPILWRSRQLPSPTWHVRIMNYVHCSISIMLSRFHPFPRLLLRVRRQESDSQYPVGRNDDDVHKVKLVVNSLGVECSLVAVYRMGQMGPHPRLLKVVLPTSKHQQLLCNRSRWLRGSQFHGVWLRPSLTKEERDRQRRERLLKEPWKRPGDQTQRSQGIRAYGDPSGVRAPRFQQWNNGGSGNY